MIKVLVVDDSALMRHVLSDILDSDPDIDVVGVAADPYIAREKIKRLNPDMITLDVEMPKMDGLQFLRNIMRLRPMPVLMVSSLTQAGAAVTLEALEIGAVDFVAKPEIDIAQGLRDYAEELIAKVKMTAAAKVMRRAPLVRLPAAPRQYAKCCRVSRRIPPARSLFNIFRACSAAPLRGAWTVAVRWSCAKPLTVSVFFRGMPTLRLAISICASVAMGRAITASWTAVRQ